MGSSTYNDASQKQLEDELIDAGSRLLMLPSSTDELLVLLEKAENLLNKVRQQPPRSTGDALLPAMKALVTDELLRHTDVNIQVAVASCINELTRITAPNPPYSDDEMKEVFPLFMIAFKQLSFEPGCNYSRATQILETVAEVRSCLILLDIGCDALIIEMFLLFFTTIRSSHSSNILKYMEMIMTLLIEESDEISLELLGSLLASIKLDNKNISPVSWELGKTVLNNCATKLQPYLREAVKIMMVDLDDYAEILSSLCVDPSNGKTMVAKEVASASKIVSVGLSDAGVSKLDGLSKTELEDGTPFIKDGDGNEHLISNIVRSDDKVVHAAGIVQSGTDKGAVRRRGRKPNSLVKPKDRYECSLATGGIDSCDVSCNGEKEELALPSEHGNGNMLNDSSKKEYDSEVNEGRLRRRGRSKKTENTSHQHSNSSPARRILRTMVKESCSNGSKRAGKKGFTGLKIIEANTVEENLNNDAKEKDGLLLPELVARKQINDEIISQKHESTSDKDKMMEYSSLSEPAKAKNLSDFASEKEKKSSRLRVSYEDELVNLRIQVWWPMDKKFYAGTVKSFDPLTKKHEIKYDDDEVEVLLLRNERWVLLDEKKPGQAPIQRKIADHLSPAKDPVNRAPIMTTKRKAMSSRKHYATSSSKRSKGESLGGLKTGENSAPDDTHMKDELNNETSVTFGSSKDVRENHAGNEE